MVKAWLWITGVPGSPKNNGWLEVNSFSFGGKPQYVGGGSGSSGSSREALHPDPSFVLNVDIAAPVIFSKVARGDIIDEIILFTEPQKEIHFYDSLITSAQAGGRDGLDSLQISIHYDKMEVQYSGSP
jgi:hypothetical protein